MKKIVIIGGGATGTGIAAEAASKGFSVILVERGNLGSGTSGSFHGMLHSGARYAVNDQVVAATCFAENQKLRQLIPSAIVDTGGLVTAFTDKETHYADTFIQACNNAGIPAEEISIKQALQTEPSLNKSLKRAFRVPDATIDGQEVLRLNKYITTQAKVPGRFMTGCEVTSMSRSGDSLTSVEVCDMRSGQTEAIECDFVINAAGVWAGQIAELADAKLEMVFDKGTMVVLEKQFTKSIINRCRPESDGDLLVPFGGHSIMGTTSRIVNSPDNNQPTPEESALLTSDGSVLVPEIQSAEILQVYAGVRPLFGSENISSGASSRTISRGFKVIDHGDQGLNNMLSVVGGKVTLYRLMAEQTIDSLMSKI